MSITSFMTLWEIRNPQFGASDYIHFLSLMDLPSDQVAHFDTIMTGIGYYCMVQTMPHISHTTFIFMHVHNGGVLLKFALVALYK